MSAACFVFPRQVPRLDAASCGDWEVVASLLLARESWVAGTGSFTAEDLGMGGET
jgi:hypothetical protein